jgi:fructose-1,6-bisphosphatase/inositol monophosphatase family enzyme
VTATEDAVADLLRAVGAEVVLPAFRHLGQGEVFEKAPGEVVTVADRRAEELLTAGLLDLLPGSVVVGEEAVAADAVILDRLKGAAPVWLVDPIDGTANYAAGREPFAMMIALVRPGRTEAAWIYEPVGDTMAYGSAGGGAYVDGVRVAAPEPGPVLRGAVPGKYFPQALRDKIRMRASTPGVEIVASEHCAGREYRDLLVGRRDFVMFWRTLPWDHVPGTLLVREVGGVVRRLDGSPYEVGEDGHGLLVAVSEDAWQAVHAALLDD